MRYLIFAAFLLCIPAANWLIGHAGTECHGDVCLIPVWPGVLAPSGVLMIGLALVLRDLVHREWGLRGALLAVGVGAVLSGLVAPPVLVVASVAAYALSELADTLVYHPLRKRGLVVAMLASSAVGLLIDSAVFLQIAFGSQEYLAGQVIGKGWAVLAAVSVIWATRKGLRQPE